MPALAPVVSPWTRGGRVFSDPLDHTSILRFLERVTGVKETNISDFRRRTLGDMTAAFRFNQNDARPPVLPDTSGPLTVATYTSANLPLPPFPGADQTPPHQGTMLSQAS
jgi:phospholipase C